MFAGTPATAAGCAGSRTGRAEQAARHDLERQIARLEARYQSLVASAFPRFDVVASGSPEASPSAPMPRLPDLATLERCRDELVARVERLERALACAHRREREMRKLRDEMLRDPRAHAGAVVTNRDCGERGCTTYRSEPRLGLLGLVFGWWRVKVSSGCPLSGRAH
ncbi:hypothetical protein HRbin41_00379 [bacterium HR41]|nr:hypothetical protein HRbin41_00379 [bacterium HR41]